MILNTHRLILSKEVPGAPTVKNFESLSYFCLRRRHEEFIDGELTKAQLSREQDADLEKVSKAGLYRKYQKPFLRVIPLLDKKTLQSFIFELKHIDKVSIKLLSTNEENINNDEFWSDLGQRGEGMNSKHVRVDFSNPKEGLDKDKVYEQASAASDLGNSEVKLKGYDSQGGTIRGSNDPWFQVITAINLCCEQVYSQPHK